MLEDLDLSRIGAPYARECIIPLLNLVEKLAMEVRTSQEENRRPRDENARLKEEKGKPDIKANTPKPPAVDYSSERERHAPKGWSKTSKTAKIYIDREQTLRLDPANLPPDAEFKGYEDDELLRLRPRPHPWHQSHPASGCPADRTRRHHAAQPVLDQLVTSNPVLLGRYKTTHREALNLKLLG